MRGEIRTPSKNPPGRWQAAPSGIAGSDVFRAQAFRFVYPLVAGKKQAESCAPLAERCSCPIISLRIRVTPGLDQSPR